MTVNIRRNDIEELKNIGLTFFNDYSRLYQL